MLDFGHLQLASATAKGNYAKVQKAQDDSLIDDGKIKIHSCLPKFNYNHSNNNEVLLYLFAMSVLN